MLAVGRTLLYNGERIGRTSGTMTTTTTSFAEITDAVDKAKASATEAPKHKLPISADDKTTILLNVEGAIKDLISSLAKKNPIKGTSIGAEELQSRMHTKGNRTLKRWVIYFLPRKLNILTGQKRRSNK